MDFAAMSGAELAALNPDQVSALSKAEKKALKERKRELWEAENQHKLEAKKPKLSKGERREAQAAQRAAKGQTAGGEAKAPSAEPTSSDAKEPAPASEPAEAGARVFRATQLFSHLPAHTKVTSRGLGLDAEAAAELHASILELGLKSAAGQVNGTDARVLAMLQAFRDLVADYEPPADQELSRHLLKRLEKAFSFLTRCRPHTAAMGNMMRTLKQVVAKLPQEGLGGATRIATRSDAEKKALVLERIDDMLQRMLLAARQIARIGAARIVDGDVVLTFGYSYAVELLLREAARVSYRLVIVDARPLHEGRHLLHSLNEACPDLPITFVCFSGLGYALGGVSKVVLGADALMSNGAAIAQAGTAAVAMAARAKHVPVMFACETYKLCRRVQLDAIVSNELGDPDDLAEAGMPSADASVERLNPLFDLTPIQFISLVVTEAGFMPPTSAPVLLREREAEEG